MLLGAFAARWTSRPETPALDPNIRGHSMSFEKYGKDQCQEICARAQRPAAVSGAVLNEIRGGEVGSGPASERPPHDAALFSRENQLLRTVKCKKLLMAEPGARPCRRLVLCNIWLKPSSVVLFSIVQKAVGEEHG